jgi:hypothetical protein
MGWSWHWRKHSHEDSSWALLPTLRRGMPRLYERECRLPGRLLPTKGFFDCARLQLASLRMTTFIMNWER